MAVALDTTGTVFTGTAVTSFTNATHTVGSISNGVLVVFLAHGSTGVTLTAATWDNGGTNQAMTLVDKKTSAGAISYVFGLLAPTAGNKTLSVSWTGSSTYAGISASFSGAAQTSFATTFKNVAKDTSTPGSIGNYPVAGLSITTNVGDMAVMSAGTGAGSFASGSGLGTQIGLTNTNVRNDDRYLLAVGTPTVLAANAATASQPYECIGCAIAAAAGIIIPANPLRRYLRR